MCSSCLKVSRQSKHHSQFPTTSTLYFAHCPPGPTFPLDTHCLPGHSSLCNLPSLESLPLPNPNPICSTRPRINLYFSIQPLPSLSLALPHWLQLSPFCSYSSAIILFTIHLAINHKLSCDAFTVVGLNRQKYLLCLFNLSHVPGLPF